MTPEDWIRIGKDIEVLAAECINSSCNIHIALKTYMVEKMINVTVNNSLFFSCFIPEKLSKLRWICDPSWHRHYVLHSLCSVLHV